MRRDPCSLFVSESELSATELNAFRALCSEFVDQMSTERPREEWECLPDLLDRLLQDSFGRVQATEAKARLAQDEWRHLQTRFAETVYASFGVAPPRLDHQELGTDPWLFVALFASRYI